MYIIICIHIDIYIYMNTYIYIYVCVTSLLLYFETYSKFIISQYIYIYKYIYIYLYIYTRIPVATLPDSSPPLALRGGSAYGPYE